MYCGYNYAINSSTGGTVTVVLELHHRAAAVIRWPHARMQAASSQAVAACGPYAAVAPGCTVWTGGQAAVPPVRADPPLCLPDGPKAPQR